MNQLTDVEARIRELLKKQSGSDVWLDKATQSLLALIEESNKEAVVMELKRLASDQFYESRRNEQMLQDRISTLRKKE